MEPDGSFVASTGDKGGWLQTYTTDKRGYPYGGSRELYLGSEVGVIAIGAAFWSDLEFIRLLRYVGPRHTGCEYQEAVLCGVTEAYDVVGGNRAVSFGPSSKIAVENIAEDAE